MMGIANVHSLPASLLWAIEPWAVHVVDPSESFGAIIILLPPSTTTIIT